MAYEAGWRQLRRDVRELRVVAEGLVGGEVLEMVQRYVEGMEGEVEVLRRRDGWEEWRREESRRVGGLAQERIIR